MKKSTHQGWTWMCLLFALGLATTMVMAQDPLEVAPESYTRILENARVRVCNVRLKPGDEIGMHSHTDHLVYFLTSGQLETTLPDGTAKELNCVAGTALWSLGGRHTTENVGATEIRELDVELKEPPEHAAFWSVSPQEDPVRVAPDAYKMLVDSDRVRVLDVRLKPGARSPLHSHPDYVTYALMDCRMRSTDPSGRSEEVDLRAGEAAWHEAGSHVLENIGTAEAHMLDIEIK